MKKRLTLQDKALIALRKAVREVIKRRAKAGKTISVWKNGKVVKISAAKLLRKK